MPDCWWWPPRRAFHRDRRRYGSHTAIAEHLLQEHRIPISASQTGRILRDLDVKPHLVRGWLNRPPDPAFFTKAKDICELYINPPADAVLLSIDEKTGIQAKSRKYPSRAVTPGRSTRREFEYRRHGTVSLMAAMNVVDGTVLANIIERNDSVTFIEFLTEIDQAIPRHLDIHLVMDNGSSHTSKVTKAWLRAHPRFHVHHTPTHASWLNMVEIWFSILTRKVLRRGEFTSRDDLADKIIKFAWTTTTKHNHSAGPTTAARSRPHETPATIMRRCTSVLRRSFVLYVVDFDHDGSTKSVVGVDI